MAFCREMLVVKKLPGVEWAEPLRCRSWSCELCAPERRKRLIAEAIAGEPNTYIVLTVNPKWGESPSHRAKMLVNAWRWARDFFKGCHTFEGRHVDNGTIPFLAVFERTKLGEPHLNVMCRSQWIPQELLSEFMEVMIGAPVVSISRITSPRQCAKYCAKYCGKDPARFETVKRYWSSQDYDLSDYEPEWQDEIQPPTFEVLRCDLFDWTNNKAREGWFWQETPQGAVAWKPSLALRATAPPSFHRPAIPAE